MSGMKGETVEREIAESSPHRFHVPQFLGVTFASVAVGLLLKNHYKSDYWELAGFITGVVGVYLTAVEHISTWPIGIANVLIYAWVFYVAQLPADMSLQFFYLALSVQGWWLWARGGSGNTTLSITRIKPFSWAIMFGLWVAGTAFYYPVVVHFKGQSPKIDSTLTVASMIAQIMLNKKKLENWILWIVIDAIYIPLYISRNLYSTALLYFMFFVLAIVGLINWSKNHKEFAHDAVGPI